MLVLDWRACRPKKEGCSEEPARLCGSRCQTARPHPTRRRLSSFIAPLAGSWRAFSGNEIGAMLAEWVLRNYRQRQTAAGGAGGRQLAVLSSTVSSRMLKAIAEREGVHWEEALTGLWAAVGLLAGQKRGGLWEGLSRPQSISAHSCLFPLEQGSSGWATEHWSWRRRGERGGGRASSLHLPLAWQAAARAAAWQAVGPSS